MTPPLDAYSGVAGQDVIRHLRQLSATLQGKRVVHVNSTKTGGGVAEILSWLIPLKQDLGLDVSWEVIDGEGEFFQATKGIHNSLQGEPVALKPAQVEAWLATNKVNVERLSAKLADADFVFIHDPQPLPLIASCPVRRGKWIWRCHIDVSRPYRPTWKLMRDLVRQYDASIFSLAAFAQPLPHPQYLISPSIDPLSEKNVPLEQEEIEEVARQFDLDPGKPVMLQVSRFDRFKDPVGVIRAYRIVRQHVAVQLVLAGGGAADDPEGQAVLEEVREEADDDPDIRVLLLPSDAHRVINALQRRAEVILQKSLREGFGLTVTEALWKHKPVIGGEVGGITLQVINGHTGYLVNTAEGAALRTRYLLSHPREREAMGEKARRFVRENFLLTRHLREYLTLMVGLEHGHQDWIVLS